MLLLWRRLGLHLLKVPQATLPHRCLDDAVLVELMEKLVGVLLSVFVHELALVLSVYEGSISLPLLPLFLRTKLFNRWELPRSWCVVFRYVFVASHFHLKVKLTLVWLTEILTFGDEMLELTTVSSIVKINYTWC